MPTAIVRSGATYHTMKQVAIVFTTFEMPAVACTQAAGLEAGVVQLGAGLLTADSAWPRLHLPISLGSRVLTGPDLDLIVP
jgi:hypothetical protein